MKRFFFLVTMAFLMSNAWAQRVVYSEPNRDDVRQTNFEIIGKYSTNVLVYKGLRNNHTISVYDYDMVEKSRIKLEFLPDRITNVDFVSYPNFAYMIYQYQRKGVVYCTAAKIGADGNKIGEPIQLDTTDVNYSNNNKLYNLVVSEDKQKIMVLKINSRNERRYLIKSTLIDKDLNTLKISRTVLPMSDRNGIITEFLLDNDGNLVFARGDRNNFDQNITTLQIIQKKAQEDTLVMRPIKLDSITLDEVKIKVDNFNNRYVLTSFFYKSKRFSIDGIFHTEWNKITDREEKNVAITLSDELRSEAHGENSIKNAFNDYYLQQIVLKKDGGFVVTAENLYTTSRGVNSGFNRWSMFSQPTFSTSDYYFGNGGWGFGNNRIGGLTRYNADDIMVLSFDRDGKLVWNHVIHKTQFDDEGEAKISYAPVNTGDAVRFLYNEFDKRDLILSVQSIAPNGQVLRYPTLKNLDQNNQFLPRYAKQVSQKIAIVPCLQNGLLLFAKIDFTGIQALN
jgi:hypothetical protein